MTDDLARLLAAGLGGFYLAHTWRHSPLPFGFLRDLRARAEAARDAGRYWGAGLTCPTCLSLWAAAGVLSLTYAGEPGRLAACILAAAGVSTLLSAAAEPPP